jgi:hypothetical protein
MLKEGDKLNDSAARLVQLNAGVKIRLVPVTFENRLCSFTELDRDRRLLERQRIAAKIVKGSQNQDLLETVNTPEALSIIEKSTVTYELEQ